MRIYDRQIDPHRNGPGQPCCKEAEKLVKEKKF